MNWAARISKEDLRQYLDVFKDSEEFLAQKDMYLRQAVQDLDLELAERLLAIGANPNISETWSDGLLHHLAHEFRSARSTKGENVKGMIELLLRNGADPNMVGANNWRAIDGCIERGDIELVELFAQYGAIREQRMFK